MEKSYKRLKLESNYLKKIKVARNDTKVLESVCIMYV